MSDLKVVFEMSDQGMGKLIAKKIEEEGGDTTDQFDERDLALTLPIIIGGILSVIALVKVILYIIREFRCRSTLDLRVEPPKNTVDCTVRDGRLILITPEGSKVNVIEPPKDDLDLGKLIKAAMSGGKGAVDHVAIETGAKVE